ncbi:hypothetical protein EB796_010903 [Bugula neritina]|uniref:Uncharacterized protein n=1 Tax=Bugula neritina TaxID=10212 RepID=A0A7J7JWM3_BUGNE|nr:hypothetical protein EB796_010903 [Bugula neritina]
MSWKRGHADGSENEEEPFDEQMLLGEDDDSYLNDDNGEEHASLLDDEDDVAVYSNTQFHTNQTHEQTLPDAELSEGELEVDDALLNDSGEEGSYGEEGTSLATSHLIDEEETTSSGPIISTLDTQVNEEEYQEFTESPNELDQQQTEAKIPAAYEHSNENIQKSQPFLPRGHRNRPRNENCETHNFVKYITFLFVGMLDLDIIKWSIIFQLMPEHSFSIPISLPGHLLLATLCRSIGPHLS